MEVMIWNAPDAEKQLSMLQISRRDVEQRRSYYVLDGRAFTRMEFAYHRGEYWSCFPVYACSDDIPDPKVLNKLIISVIDLLDHELVPIRIYHLPPGTHFEGRRLGYFNSRGPHDQDS